MGKPDTFHRRNRRKFQQVINETKCGHETSDRWKVVRLGHNRIPLRGSTPPHEWNTTNEKRNISTLIEWHLLKYIIQQICVKYPTRVSTTPCYYQPDHQNQAGAHACTKCNLFQFEEKYFSMPAI